MTIQYKFFTIPINAADQMESALNRFLVSKRTLTVHREFVQNGANSFWSLAVEYLSDGNVGAEKTDKSRVDYREVLSPDDFALYVKLRDWRKQEALKEGLALYNIFNNEQLAEIAEKRVATLSALKEIEGIGEARIKKYGKAVLALVVSEGEGAVSGEEASGKSAGRLEETNEA